MGIYQFCDADCTVQYTKNDVVIFDPDGVPLLVEGTERPKQYTVEDSYCFR